MSTPTKMGKGHPFDTASVRTLLGTLVVAVFVFIPLASVPFAATKSFVLAGGAILALAFYIVARLTRGNIIVPASWIFPALWLPAAAYLLASVFSGVSFSRAFWGTMLEPDTFGFMLTATVLGMLAALILRSKERLSSFLKVVTLAFGALALSEAVLIVLGKVVPSIPAGFSFLGSVTELPGMLGVGVVGTLLAFRFAKLSGRTRGWLWLSGAAALFVLALAGSSLVWVLLGLVSLGLFVEGIMRRGGRAQKTSSGSDPSEDLAAPEEAPVPYLSNFPTPEPETTPATSGRISLVPPLVVLVVSLFFFIGGSFGGLLASALNINTFNVRPSWQSTLTVAQKTYATAPVFGSGPGTFGVQWLKYREAALNTTAFWNVDFTSGFGFIPSSFVTTGVVGAIAWLAFFLIFMVFGARTLIWRTPEDQQIRFTAIFSFVGALYLFTLAFFGLPSPSTLVLAFFLAGVFVSTTRFARNGEQLGIVFSRLPGVGFLVVFTLTLILLASVGAAYRLVEQYLAVSQITIASTALATGNYAQAQKATQASLAFVPLESAYQMQAAIDRATLNTIAASSTMSKTAAQKAYQTALSDGVSAALAATKLNPSDYRNWLALGSLYAEGVPLGVSGSYQSALTAYKKAETLNPTNPQIPYLMAQLAIANKDSKAAQTYLKQAIGLKANYTNAIFLLSQLEVRDGNIKDALNASLAAAYFTPNNPNILFQVGVLYAAEKDYPHAVEALAAAVKANPNFANARYLLAAVYATQKNYSGALTQLNKIAALSKSNAKAVAPLITALSTGKNPFPADLLKAPAQPVSSAPSAAQTAAAPAVKK